MSDKFIIKKRNNPDCGHSWNLVRIKETGSLYLYCTKCTAWKDFYLSHESECKDNKCKHNG
jgi:hypothetical protein